jgi:hypothetical protein
MINNFLLDVLAAGAILSGILVITSKNPVIAVLFLISTFCYAVEYLILLVLGEDYFAFTFTKRSARRAPLESGGTLRALTNVATIMLLIVLVHSIGLYFESFGLILMSTMLPVKPGDNKSPGKLTKVEKTETKTSSHEEAIKGTPKPPKGSLGALNW